MSETKKMIVESYHALIKNSQIENALLENLNNYGLFIFTCSSFTVVKVPTGIEVQRIGFEENRFIFVCSLAT